MRKPNPLKIISALTPYLAVAFGLYVISNGWVTFLLYHTGLFAFILISGRMHVFNDTFKGWHWSTGVTAVFICSLTGLLLLWIWPYSSKEPGELSSQLAAVNLTGTGWLIFAIIFIAVNPIMEEVFWRSFLDENAEGKLPYLADAVFAGYHVPVLALFIKPQWLVLAFIIIFLAGCVWRYLTRRFSGNAIALASHIAADISIVAAVQLLAQ